MNIIRLNENTIKRIAAGEVIARPANAIKELIENAIDANADQIIINIAKNPLEKIVITDNGVGIQKEDLAICTELHTTSKTNDDDQLFGLHSFGFRGEALASIDAISDLIIESNEYRLEKHSGIKRILNSAIQRGTRIEIREMFEHLPARLQFLKSSNVEISAIKQTIQKYMMNFANISWQVFFNEKKLWHFEKSTKAERIEQIMHEEATPFHAENNGIKLEGYLLKQSKEQILFINQRPVRDKGIFGYLKTIFTEYFMRNEAPGFVLFLTLDPMLIDCNVHPSKEEVKLINYSPIFSVLSYAFSPALFNNFLKKNTAAPQPEAFLAPVEEVALNLEYKEYSKPYSTPKFSQEISYVREVNPYIAYNTYEPVAPKPAKIYPHKIIGQIKKTYIIFETEEGIGMFDQHAAHERAVYEEMKKELNAESAQQLLVPLQLTLSEEKKEYIDTHKQIFANKGIRINSRYEITHIPIALQKANFIRIFEENLDEHTEPTTFIERFLADIACKNALKANTEISLDTMHALLETALQNPPICNHGRPIFKYFKLSEIENWFKR